ncbi:putative peptidoglycan binding protein [Luteibacter sp. OK325]|nr:putative peptidoglycan binding protein [Luteibacter sp. OK325]
MVEKHKRDSKGRLRDDVRTDPVTAADRKAYTKAAHEVGDLSVPRMFNSSDPHSRFYIANFDGTGNDLWKDPEHATNVGKLHLQLVEAGDSESRIHSNYIKGAGTQDGVIARTIDSGTGGSYDERIEWMYFEFITQAKKWLDADPDADIRILATGFSRGAEQAAGFLRLVHERGIQNPLGREVIHHAFGPDTYEWHLPPLREPGKTLMSEALFDPVGTGAPNNHDRQPTSAMTSGIQITAEDERRNAFPSTQIIPPGRSADGRFVGMTLPGAHSDIGGSYHQNGLSILTFNIFADYINALAGKTVAHRLMVPTDPDMFVIHHSEDHLRIYSTSEFRHDGYRDIMGSQASPPHCNDKRKLILCAPPDRFDPRLEDQVGPRYPVGIHGPDAIRELSDPMHPDHDMYRSASVQLAELHARAGIDLNRGQVDQLTAGLVIEAKRGDMTAIEDVRFGKDFSPERPTLQAFEVFGDEIANPRSRTASIDALKALDVPPGVSNQQLHMLNLEREAVAGREQEMPLSRDNPFALEPSASALSQPVPVVSPSQDAALGQADENAIRTLQKNLNTLGIRDMAGEPLNTHGAYDVATQTAVARFQSSHALPVTGQADDATRNRIEGQAFIAELQQPGQVRMPTEARVSQISTPSPATAAYESPIQAPMARAPAPPMLAQQSRSDPRNPDSTDHALYSKLQNCLPEATEERLMQFTAACHRHRINAGNLSGLHTDYDSMTLTINSHGLMATPAVVDMSTPPPESEQSIKQIQQFDQQMDQIAQQSQERSAQMGQQGPVM